MAVKSLKRSSFESPAQTHNSANAGYSFQDFHHLETIQLGATATSVTFSNLDRYFGDYKHLQIRYDARSTFASHASSFALRFNSDTATNYSQHRLLGTGSAVVSDAATSQNFADVGYVSAASATSGNFGGGIIDILDAFSTSKNKTTRVLTGVVGTTNRIGLHSSNWRNTAAITSVTLWSYDGNIDTGSRFSLYGIR